MSFGRIAFSLGNHKHFIVLSFGGGNMFYFHQNVYSLLHTTVYVCTAKLNELIQQALSQLTVWPFLQ